jgi:hypothetical protein
VDVQLTRRVPRGRLSCVRADGTRTSADVGPGVPYHDLAHFVVERRLGLSRGFFGHIAAGYSIASLSDKDVIRTLDPESMLAEILARALGSLATGACTAEQLPALVNEELAQLGLATFTGLGAPVIAELSAEFDELAGRYRALGEGESLTLRFD